MVEQKYIVFFVDNERYALPIESVERILPEMSVTSVPKTPKVLLGVFDLRGETLPALDLRRRFDLEEHDGMSNYIVVESSDAKCAWRVDKVDGIVSTSTVQREAPPPNMQQEDDPFVAGILQTDEKLVVLLDPEYVVPKALRKKVKQLAAA